MNYLLKIKKILFFRPEIDNLEQKVQQQIWDDNRKFSLIWASIQLFYWGFCFIMSFFEARFILCRNVYITALVLNAISLACTVLILRKMPRLINLIKIIISATILGSGLFIAVSVLPQGYNTITIFVSAILIPILFVNNTLLNIIIILFYNIISAIVLNLRLNSEIFISSIIDLIIFSSIGIVLGYFVNKTRIERYVFAESAMALAELQIQYANYDSLTGLKTRRPYSEKKEQLAVDLPENCCVVIADINNLKGINNTFGHDEGDKLIMGAAECLQKSFEGIETIYRIGGDEFCIILINANVDIDNCLKKFEKRCSEWKGEHVNGISVSFGYATAEEFSDIDEILKIADKRMYKSKRDYYRTLGTVCENEKDYYKIYKAFE